MKYRPPLRTAEINAWNFGARGRALGFTIGDLAPLGNLPPRLALTLGELEALDRLGPDAFERWSARGWVEGERPFETPRPP
jgi:hypothetical protein